MPHTDTITVTIEGYSHKPDVFTLPREIGDQLTHFLKHSADDESIPAELAFPELYDPVTGPGLVLKGARAREDMTQKQLAEKTGIRQHHISEMENGKRVIGKDVAQKLAKALDTDYRHFL